MKRTLSFLLSLVMVIGIITSVPISVNAAMVNGDFEYKYIENDTKVAITKYIGNSKEAYIPNKIDGKYVTVISESAFKNNGVVTYVWMGNGIETIGNFAFSNCKTLENIDFGSGLKTIGKETFYGCSSLVELVFPDSLEKIDYYEYHSGTFVGCASLKKVVIGNGLKNVPREAFKGCASLETIVFGESVETIETSAFEKCVGLKELIFPDSLKIIGDFSFSGCTNVKNVSFGSGVKKIGKEAFYGCKSLVELIFPDSLEEIDYYEYHNGTFEGCTALKSVVIGNGLNTISSELFKGCTSLKSVVFGESVETIEASAFEGCTALVDVFFNDSIEIIGTSAFQKCTSLEKITIPDCVQNVGNFSFSGCTKLKDVSFGSGVKTIGKEAFYGCKSLVELIFPDSLEEIDYYEYHNGTFEGCASLKSVVIGNGLKSVPCEAFKGCSSLETVIFGESVEIIKSSAFADCISLKEITFPDSIQTIEEYSFTGCTNLKSISFGSGLKTIGAQAFKKCTSLLEVILPDSLEEIGFYSYHEGAFEGCTSLKIVVIGDGLKNIPDRVFRGCTSLESVVIGESVETINSAAFKDCSKLNKVYFLGNNPTSIAGENESLNNAKWYHLPFAEGFSQGSVSSTYHSVTFDANGGYLLIDDVEEETYSKYSDNGKVAAVSNPQREGYTFLGWYNNANGTGAKINPTTEKITKDTTYYAKWEKNTYRIYFDARGGNVSSGGKDVAYGESIGQLPTPTLSGDVFNGWYLGMNSSGPQYTATSKMPAKDIILYAGWDSNDTATTVIFDTQGGSFILPITVNVGDKVSKPQNPTRNGYEFIGWYKDANHNTKFDFGNDKINATTTIYALWKPILLNAPTGLKVSEITDISAKISWNGVEGAKAYYIYVDDEFKGSTSSNQFVIGKLLASTKYVISVTAVNSVGESLNATEATFSTIHVCKPSSWITDTKATVYQAGSKHKECTDCKKILETSKIAQLKCSAPKLSKVTNVATGIKFTWNKVTGADNYEVYRKTGSGKWTKIATVKGSVTSYTDKKVKSGTTYKYTVKAKNEAGLSKYNTTGLTIKCLADPVLKTPASTKSGITLKWNKVTGAQGYVIYRKAGNGSFKKLTTVKGVTKVSYVDKSAKKGTKYTYKLKAYSGKTYSAYSNAKTIKDKY